MQDREPETIVRHDLHATILHLMGVDHMKLVDRHKGRPEPPTLNEGEAFTRIALC